MYPYLSFYPFLLSELFSYHNTLKKPAKSHSPAFFKFKTHICGFTSYASCFCPHWLSPSLGFIPTCKISTTPARTGIRSMLITAMQTPALSKISYFSLLFFRIIRFCLLEYVQSFELNFEQLPAVMEETFFAVPI